LTALFATLKELHGEERKNLSLAVVKQIPTESSPQAHGCVDTSYLALVPHANSGLCVAALARISESLLVGQISMGILAQKTGSAFV